MGYVSGWPYLCVAFMTISLGFNGALAQSVLCNYHDLAPNYATTLNAFMNGISSCSGFVSPLIVAYFTADDVSAHFDRNACQYCDDTRFQNGIGQWQYVFAIGAFAYIAPAVLFMFLGSGDVQPWNDPNWTKPTGKPAEAVSLQSVR